eukprot:Sspe_Gene.13119::Locus_4502_Transcript_1_1_Confidence_1.000_Length_2627::g.13119::m.13119
MLSRDAQCRFLDRLAKETRPATHDVLSAIRSDGNACPTKHTSLILAASLVHGEELGALRALHSAAHLEGAPQEEHTLNEALAGPPRVGQSRHRPAPAEEIPESVDEQAQKVLQRVAKILVAKAEVARRRVARRKGGREVPRRPAPKDALPAEEEGGRDKEWAAGVLGRMARVHNAKAEAGRRRLQKRVEKDEGQTHQQALQEQEVAAMAIQRLARVRQAKAEVARRRIARSQGPTPAPPEPHIAAPEDLAAETLGRFARVLIAKAEVARRRVALNRRRPRRPVKQEGVPPEIEEMVACLPAEDRQRAAQIIQRLGRVIVAKAEVARRRIALRKLPRRPLQQETVPPEIEDMVSALAPDDRGRAARTIQRLGRVIVAKAEVARRRIARRKRQNPVPQPRPSVPEGVSLLCEGAADRDEAARIIQKIGRVLIAKAEVVRRRRARARGPRPRPSPADAVAGMVEHLPADRREEAARVIQRVGRVLIAKAERARRVLARRKVNRARPVQPPVDLPAEDIGELFDCEERAAKAIQRVVKVLLAKGEVARRRVARRKVNLGRAAASEVDLPPPMVESPPCHPEPVRAPHSSPDDEVHEPTPQPPPEQTPLPETHPHPQPHESPAATFNELFADVSVGEEERRTKIEQNEANARATLWRMHSVWWRELTVAKAREHAMAQIPPGRIRPNSANSTRPTSAMSSRSSKFENGLPHPARADSWSDLLDLVSISDLPNDALLHVCDDELEARAALLSREVELRERINIWHVVTVAKQHRIRRLGAGKRPMPGYTWQVLNYTKADKVVEDEEGKRSNLVDIEAGVRHKIWQRSIVSANYTRRLASRRRS